jgi:hypothetical protein
VHSRLKGALLATVAFGYLAIAYILFKMLSLAARTPSVSGGSTGISVVQLGMWTVKSPAFWILFLVAVAVGSEIAHRWPRFDEPAIDVALKVRGMFTWMVKGTLIGLTTFVLGSVVYMVVMPGSVYTVGSSRFWVGFAAVMAFGYYVAKSSNPRIWIIKGLLTGFGALIPISVFFLLIKLQESSPTGPGILREMIVKSPLYWILAVATVAWACYVTKPRSIHSVAH